MPEVDYQRLLEIYHERLKIFGPFHKSVVLARQDCERFARERF